MCQIYNMNSINKLEQQNSNVDQENNRTNKMKFYFNSAHQADFDPFHFLRNNKI